MDAPAYQPGSEADFDRLYRDSHDRLLRTLTAMLRDRDAAEDCVQETFVKAFRAWPRWRPDAPAEAWLHRIAVNVATSHRRRESIREVGQLLRRLGRPPASDFADPTGQTDLLASLRRLPPRQAAVIVLRHHHGYSNREIATALGVPESTVASRLAAAKGRLLCDLAISGGGLELAIEHPSR